MATLEFETKQVLQYGDKKYVIEELLENYEMLVKDNHEMKQKIKELNKTVENLEKRFRKLDRHVW